MRILEMVSQYERNGAMIYARRIIPLLRARGHEVWLAARPDSWIARETAGEATLVPTHFVRWPLAEPRRVAELCRRERIAVVHSHLTRAHNFSLWLRALGGPPGVAHSHSHHFQPHWYFHRLVVAVSRGNLRRLRARLAALGRRGRVLHNFVDTAKFAPRASPADASAGNDPLRAAFGIPAGAPVVAQVAEINPRKGQLCALRAAARVRHARADTHFVFLGAERCAPDYLATLRTETERHGLANTIHWAGRREDVAELLPHATAAILPSLDEPFSLAGLEAMACGVPLVASRVGGFPEMVEDGVSGALVPSENDAALAEALLRLLEDPARRTAAGAAARAKVVAEFSPEPHVARLEALLAEAAGRNGL
jgi:glycosyltransferase involved in cell wall biosynthesis